MKRVSIIVALLLLCVVSAFAIEPSKVVVSVNGKSYFKHKVESGETLYALAKAYNVTEKQILSSNVGLSAETLKADEYILIPRLQKNKGSERRVDTDATANSAKDIFISHKVESGETVYSIARRYKISVAMLEEDNPKLDIDHISPGDIIMVRRADRGYVTSDDIERERAEREARTAETLGDDEHRVAAGETIYSLSHRFGLSEEEFMTMNNLKEYSDLKAGMVVKTKKCDSTAPNNSTEEKGLMATMADAVVETATEVKESITDVFRRVDRKRRGRGDAEVAVSDTTAMVESVDILADGAIGTDMTIAPVDVAFPPLSHYHTLKMALMLPFHMNGKVNPYFVDFYRGVLLAMEDLKIEGYDIDLSVFDTCGDATRINDIVSYEEGFLDAQLIIGPVYETEVRYVIGYAEEHEVPLVSPLADVGALQSPVLFQMQADAAHKSDKIAGLLSGEVEIVTIYSSTTDYDYLKAVRSFSEGVSEQSLNYVFDRGSFFYERRADGSNGAEVDIVEFMRTKQSKAFVIASKDETEVDRILTTLASTKASITARSMSYGDYIVVGNRKWKQSGNIEKQSFFRNNTVFVAPYYANRSSESVRLFDSRYVKAYEAMPTMYSYRGYDAAMIFCRKMFTGIDAGFASESFTPLATTYNFLFEDGHYTNANWTLEHYKSNFTIEVK